MSGFQAPNYTQVPNDYFDLVMEMTEAENKVLAALLRATLGYHRDEIKLSIRELARITRLDPKSVMTGARKLEERGLIERTVGKITTVSKWTVVIDDPKLWEKIVKTVPAGQYKNNTLPLKKEKKVKESDEIFAIIAKSLASIQGGGLKSTDGDYISTWLEKHQPEWICKAIETAKHNGAKSSKYVDSILIGWEANGYPKSREQLIQERKGKPSANQINNQSILQQFAEKG